MGIHGFNTTRKAPALHLSRRAVFFLSKTALAVKPNFNKFETIRINVNSFYLSEVCIASVTLNDLVRVISFHLTPSSKSQAFSPVTNKHQCTMNRERDVGKCDLKVKKQWSEKISDKMPFSTNSIPFPHYSLPQDVSH